MRNGGISEVWRWWFPKNSNGGVTIKLNFIGKVKNMFLNNIIKPPDLRLSNASTSDHSYENQFEKNKKIYKINLSNRSKHFD